MDLNKKYLENVIANLSKKNLPKLYVRPHRFITMNTKIKSLKILILILIKIFLNH